MVSPTKNGDPDTNPTGSDVGVKDCRAGLGMLGLGLSHTVIGGHETAANGRPAVVLVSNTCAVVALDAVGQLFKKGVATWKKNWHVAVLLLESDAKYVTL